MPMFDLKTLASAPLTFTYPISASISIVTTVIGDARQYATVAIMYSSLNMWSGTMTQLAPIITIPYIVEGEITIEKGGTFTLTVPAALQNGFVAADLMIKTATQPVVPFAGTVAIWPLSS